MRDFYDIHILNQIYGDGLDRDVLHDALLTTSRKRESEEQLVAAKAVFDDIEESNIMQKLLASYQKKVSYSEELSWKEVMKSVREVYEMMDG